MRMILLGSGASSGMPAWNDGFELARKARSTDSSVPRRSGLALGVSADGERFSILEAPASLASRITEIPELAPRPGSRSTPLDTVVLTDAELDATVGLLCMRTGLSIRIASPHGIRNALLEHSSPFRTLEAAWGGVPLDRAFPLDREGALEARFFPLPGPAPDYLRELAPKLGRARAGLRILDRRSGLRVVWAPRVARFDSATLAELRAADLRFIDGRFLLDGEVQQTRPDARCAFELGHVPVEGKEGSLVWLSGMSGRSIYVGFDGANALVDPDGEDAARIRASGVEIGFDGMEIDL